MKRNNIIYPNTPFFRKYAGKLLVPAGVDGDTFLFYAAWYEDAGEYILAAVAISANDLAGITFKIDGEAGGEVIETIVDDNLISDVALAGVTIPASCIGMNAALVEQSPVTAGEHTVSATFEGVTKEETVTVG